jgi:hypothetical protein
MGKVGLVRMRKVQEKMAVTKVLDTFYVQSDGMGQGDRWSLVLDPHVVKFIGRA